MFPKPYYPVVLDLLARDHALTVLDAPCGTGWLGRALKLRQPDIQIDGLGLYEFPAHPEHYRDVVEHDLDFPAPYTHQGYDAAVCAEAIHLLSSPGVLLQSCRRALRPGGRLIITTPNAWRPASRLRYFLRGFHSGFAPSADLSIGHDYITYFPFTFSQLHLLLRHHGFRDIQVHAVEEPKPARWIDRLLALPGLMACRQRMRHAKSDDAREYWKQLASPPSLLGRWLVVSAING